MRKNLIWLASYPKSGNTWFRAFLYALFNDSPVDINKLASTAINFAHKGFLEEKTDFFPDDFYDAEIKCLLPEVYQSFALKEPGHHFFKIHDAYTFNKYNQPIIPEEVTLGAVYFLRNPLDVVTSLANHYAFSIDEGIEMLNNNNRVLAEQKDNLNIKVQFQQLIQSWNLHVRSWTEIPRFPVLVVKYEDMLENTFETFSGVLQFFQLSFTPAQVHKAINACSFNLLKEQEKQATFIEKLPQTQSFFNEGKKDRWKDFLSGEQAKKILHNNEELMKLYGYI